VRDAREVGFTYTMIIWEVLDQERSHRAVRLDLLSQKSARGLRHVYVTAIFKGNTGPTTNHPD